MRTAAMARQTADPHSGQAPRMVNLTGMQPGQAFRLPGRVPEMA